MIVELRFVVDDVCNCCWPALRLGFYNHLHHTCPAPYSGQRLFRPFLANVDSKLLHLQYCDYLYDDKYRNCWLCRIFVSVSLRRALVAWTGIARDFLAFDLHKSCTRSNPPKVSFSVNNTGQHQQQRIRTVNLYRHYDMKCRASSNALICF